MKMKFTTTFIQHDGEEPMDYLVEYEYTRGNDQSPPELKITGLTRLDVEDAADIDVGSLSEEDYQELWDLAWEHNGQKFMAKDE